MTTAFTSNRRVAAFAGVLAAAAIAVAVGQTGHADGNPPSCSPDAAAVSWPDGAPAVACS